jgi:hypothetical protein
MDVLAGSNALYKRTDDRSYYQSGNGNAAAADALSLWDSFPGFGASDLGNPDRTTWATATKRMLSNSDKDFAVFPHLRSVVVWSWCGQAASATEADIDTYTGLMSGLEADYPNVTFVYMTGHLDGSGEGGNLNKRNNQIRAFVKQSPGRVLFDFADIESYDPDGAYYLDKNATDGCAYDGGNWATAWCAAHAGHELCAANSCAHSEPLNCNVKARAFWWLLSQVAGCSASDGGAGGSAGSGGSPGSGGTAGSGGGTAGGGGLAGAAGSSVAGSGAAPDAGAPVSATPAADEGGCSCGLVGTAGGTPTALLLALGAWLAHRARRARR